MGVFEIGLLYVGGALLLLLTGMPIAFALALAAMIAMLFFMPIAAVFAIPETLFSELDNFTLLAVPLFILMGTAIGKTRAAADLYGALYMWLYRLPGGLGIANVAGCVVFSAMCGSSPATCAAIGGMGIPEMRRRGYSDRLSTGLIAAGGTLGILIPPSITLIIYGIIAEQSIGRLFIAGVIPGLALAGLFSIWVVLSSWRDLRRTRANSGPTVVAESYSWSDRLKTLPRLLPFLILISIILFALYGGMGTPSEVAGAGAFAVLVFVALLYGCYRWRDLKPILGSAAQESCMIMMIVAMSFVFTYVMSYLYITQSAAEWLIEAEMSRWAFLLLVNLLMLVLGCFLPPVTIILMVTPVVLPAVIAHGFDPIWFGVMMTINMELGLITPPVGLNLFVIKGIAPDVSLRSIVAGAIPFILIIMGFMVLLTIFPEIVLWLPNFMIGQ